MGAMIQGDVCSEQEWSDAPGLNKSSRFTTELSGAEESAIKMLGILGINGELKGSSEVLRG
eukprot:1949828-Prymnesium_polylepis.1